MIQSVLRMDQESVGVWRTLIIVRRHLLHDWGKKGCHDVLCGSHRYETDYLCYDGERVQECGANMDDIRIQRARRVELWRGPCLLGALGAPFAFKVPILSY